MQYHEASCESTRPWSLLITAIILMSQNECSNDLLALKMVNAGLATLAHLRRIGQLASQLNKAHVSFPFRFF